MKILSVLPLLALSSVSVFAQLTLVEQLADGGRDQANNTIDGLARPYGVLTSPDDEFFYVVGIDDNAITVFDRDRTTGRLTFIESLFSNGFDQDNNRITGLQGAINLAMSVDGKHVYVASLGNNVSVFSRDATTGRLRFVEALFTGGQDQLGNTISGLAEAVNIDLSPDGKHLYVTARASAGSLTVFSRDATTGRLTFVENLVDNATDVAGNTLDGIRKPYGVKVSKDNEFVYVASTIEASVAVLSRDTNTGQLTMVEVLRRNGTDQANNAIGDALFGANNLTITDDNRFVYVTAFSGDAISVFQRTIATGVLTFIQTLPNGGTDGSNNTIVNLNGPQVVETTDNRAYVGAAVARAVAVFERNPNTGLLTFLESKVNETDGITLLNDPEGLTLSRDKKFLYATGDALNGLVVFEENNPQVPVELLYFKGTIRQNQQVQLQWETASELNNEGFWVERANRNESPKQLKWIPLGYLKGEGTTTLAQRYEFLDTLPIAGNYYYRLRQEDFDGTINYSDIVAIDVQKSTLQYRIYPNPTDGFIQIELPQLIGSAEVKLFDLQGRLLLQQTVSQQDNTVSISQLSKGMYRVELNNGQYGQLLLIQ